jgi:hypothetical protein
MPSSTFFKECEAVAFITPGIAAAITAVASIGGVAASVLNKPKLPTAIPIATRDEAAAQQQQDDDLRQRRGAAADILTGSAGAEAGAGATFVAGS